MTCRDSLLVLSLLLGLTSCTQFPDLDKTALQTDAPYPELAPIELSRTSVPTDRADRAQIQQDVLSRVAALRARAARLSRGAIVDAPTKARMRAGVRAR